MTPSPADPSHALDAECLKALRAIYPDIEDPNEALPEAVFDLYEYAGIVNALPGAIEAIERALGHTDVDADSPPVERLADAARRVTAQAGEIASLRDRLDAAERRADDAQGHRRQLDAKLGQVRIDRQKAQSDADRSRSKIHTLEAQLGRTEEQLERARDDDNRKSLVRENESLKGELRTVQAQRDRAREDLERIREKHAADLKTINEEHDTALDAIGKENRAALTVLDDALDGALKVRTGLQRSRWKLNHFLARLLAALEGRDPTSDHNRLCDRTEEALARLGIKLAPASPTTPEFRTSTRDPRLAAVRKKLQHDEPAAPQADPPGEPVDFFVGNLPASATEDDLRGFFGARADRFLDLRIVRNRSGKSRCFGFVTVANADANAVLAFHGRPLRGRALRIATTVLDDG